MKVLSYVFETSLRFSEPVTAHSFVLRCLPRSTSAQTVMEAQVFTNPRLQLNEMVDGFGNRIVSGWCPAPHRSFDFYASGIAMVDAACRAPEPAHPMFLMSTPLTQADGGLLAAANEVREALHPCVEAPNGENGDAPDAFALALALSARVYEAFTYAPGTTDTRTTAAEAFAAAQGVCQDYTHVFIALCRACGIPARYATGLMEGEGATHAWAEIHDGVRWIGVDPTHNRVTDDSYLLLSYGRDFSDCPVERGVFRGSAKQTQAVSASVGEGSNAAGVFGASKAAAHVLTQTEEAYG